MWYLTSKTDSRIIYVTPGNEIVIGRSIDAQNCNFAIPEDTSISRKHAMLSVSSDNNLFLQDLGSKYGTFINDGTEKLDSYDKKKLSCDDIVRFGKMGSTWNVHSRQLVTCTSTLKGENIQILQANLIKLGATLKSDWDESCTYLTMPAITLTIKVVLALVQGSNIVTPTYWVKCVEAVDENKELPDPHQYLPQIVETTLNKENVSFLPNNKRSTLFAGKTFIFFSKPQMEMYRVVVQKSSATALLMSETKMTKSGLCDEDIIVIQYNKTSTSQETLSQKNKMDEIINYIKSKGKRIVADAEIGLALLYCSTAKYCNPDFNFSSEVIKRASVDNTKTAKIIAQESQEYTQFISKSENVVINETLSGKASATDTIASNVASSKRKTFDENDDMVSNVSKKIATADNVTITMNNNSKKRGPDDDDMDKPVKKMAIEDENMFNFMKSSSDENSNGSIGQKLNLSKPMKRKQEMVDDEEDLFNFVDDNTGLRKEKQNRSETDRMDAGIGSEDSVTNQAKKTKLVTEVDDVDITALRGSKLKELMGNNSKVKNEVELVANIKKEIDTELDEKFNKLDLGYTILTVKDLIIKKEPVEVISENMVKNFKKFKKVWPVKMNVTVVPKSLFKVVKSDITLQDITSLSGSS